MTVLRLGTRGSLLALTQSRMVARAIEAASGRSVEMTVIQTQGDLNRDRPLPEIGGKGLFTAELDRALEEGEIHFAVHSLKDLPTEIDPDLVVAAVPEREDARDALVGPEGSTISLESLPEGAVVGTSSLRRQALALAFRPDLVVRPIRGNLDTRLRKVDGGDFDAVIVAAAGLRRLGREDRANVWLELTSWLPAPGQGALGIVARRNDGETRDALGVVHHEATARAVQAERTVLSELGGGCRLPIAAVGMPYGEGLRLWGLVASPDGRRLVRADETGEIARPEDLGRRVAARLVELGAAEILDSGPGVEPVGPSRP